MIEAFKQILANGSECRLLKSEKDTEFLNLYFWQMRQRHNIHFYTSENEDIKVSMVEHFNRTLTSKMNGYFTFKNTWRYADMLQQLIDSYNATSLLDWYGTEQSRRKQRRTSSRASVPVKIVKKILLALQCRRHGSNCHNTTFAFYKMLCDGQLNMRTLQDCLTTTTISATYTLCDLIDEPIKSKFYEPELQ